jgi:hypothetical protein
MSIPDDAYSFAVKQIQRRSTLKLEPWPPCLMVDLARAAGIEFSEQRHWGPVFRRLSREGYIKRAGLFSRASSNNSVRPGWLAV